MIKMKSKLVKVNRKNLRLRLTDKADEGEKDLKTDRVSLALDCWTSRMNNAYIGMSLVVYKLKFELLNVHFPYATSSC